MTTKINVLITGPEQTLCDAVKSLLDDQTDIQTAIHIDKPGQADPMNGLGTLPDVLITRLGSDWEKSLRGLAARPVAQRPATIVIGQTSDPQAMRLAMQAGARDYFAPPLSRVDLLQAVRVIGSEKGIAVQNTPMGPLTAVINAKGGSGASFIAVNLAHMLASNSKKSIALLDLDLQFGALPLALDLDPQNSLLAALAASEQLDSIALNGYMTKHKSGVHVLSAMSDQLPLPWEISSDALRRVLTLTRKTYPGVIVDLPRQIDPLTSAVLSMADCVIVVMQQSVAHVRDAKRMQRVLTSTLGVPREHIVLVVNRHNSDDAITLKDITETVQPPRVSVLPNDFLAVSESLNTGVPLIDYARNAPITRMLLELAATLNVGESTPNVTPPKQGGLRAAFVNSFRL